ncbi:MAG: ABC transporter permease [Rhodospirillales bacterium]
MRRRLLRPNAAIGLTIIAVVGLAALIGEVYTPYDPLTLSIRDRLAPPSATHLLGTDHFGRDVFSRLLKGAGVSLSVSLMTVAFALGVGIAVGAVIGFFGGWLDRLAMALVDALLAFPGLMLALGIMAVLGPNKYGVVLALGIAYTPSVVRMVRGQVLSIKQREFVEASSAMGNSAFYTLWRHVVPNCIGPLTVLGTALFAFALLSESALSFLGLGVPPPEASWGGMLADSRQYIGQAFWLGLFPGLAISVTLLGVNLFGDALRDRFDPRMNRLG